MEKIRIKSEISNIFIIKFDKNIADLYFSINLKEK